MAMVDEQTHVWKASGTVVVNLKGLLKLPDANAKVAWDVHTGEVIVYTSNLPKPPLGKQYQLWALDKGAPVDAGVFDVNDKLQLL